MSQNKQKGKKRKEMNEDMFDMDENRHLTSNATICNGVMRSYRELRPADYLLKIKSYSTLAASKLERYKCDEFVVGDHKWRMIVYLRGNNEVNRDKYISLYLAVETEFVDYYAWELLVDFKFFVLDQINDRYLVIQDLKKPLKRFNAAKSQWGFAELLSIDTFRDVSNGFLVNDSCTFGVEVFVVECSGDWGRVSSVKAPLNGAYTWKLNNFSQFEYRHNRSESFTIGGTDWKLRTWNSDGSEKNEFLSIFLDLKESSIDLSKKWYAEFTIRLKNQKSPLRSRALNGAMWFTESDYTWESLQFISMKELKDEANGYYLNDSVIIECQITNLCEAEHFSTDKYKRFTNESSSKGK